MPGSCAGWPRKLLMRAGFTEDQAVDVLRTVVLRAHALAEACFTVCADCDPWPDDELSQDEPGERDGAPRCPDHLCADGGPGC